MLVSDTALLKATSSIDGKQNSTASGLGFGADGRSDARVWIGESGVTNKQGAKTQVEIDDRASLTARSVALRAIVTKTHAEAISKSYGAGFYSEGLDDATVEVTANAEVLIRANATVTGFEGVDFQTRFEDMRDQRRLVRALDRPLRLRRRGRDEQHRPRRAGARRGGRAHHGRPARPGRREPRRRRRRASARVTPGSRSSSTWPTTAPSTESNATRRRAREQALARRRRRQRGRHPLRRHDEHPVQLERRDPLRPQPGARDRLERRRSRRRSRSSVYDGVGQRRRASPATISSATIIVNDIVEPGRRRRRLPHRRRTADNSDTISGSGGTWTFFDTLPQVRIVNNSSQAAPAEQHQRRRHRRAARLARHELRR